MIILSNIHTEAICTVELPAILIYGIHVRAASGYSASE